MQLYLLSLVLIQLALHVTANPIPGQKEVIKSSMNLSPSLTSSDDGFPAMLSKLLSRDVATVRRTRRTVPHLQAAWTLHIVCKADPDHPRCSQHVVQDSDQDMDIIARYNRRKYRHRRRHSHRH